MTIIRGRGDPRSRAEKVNDKKVLKWAEYHHQLDALESLMDFYGINAVEEFVAEFGTIKHCCKHHDKRFLNA